MRIISGKLKGRKFEMPGKTTKTRPTTDFGRESLFNILQHQIDLQDIHALDLFSGTGAVGYEFISRGATKVSFVENDAPCILFIKQCLQQFDVAAFAAVNKSDVFKYLSNCSEESFDVVFADPPYALDKMMAIPGLVFDRKILKKEGILIIEHDERHNFENHANFAELRKYGQSIFSIFE
jgi:16S rRNA (guanine966-N2)-methyltransferase